MERLSDVLRPRFHVLLRPVPFLSVDHLIDTTMALAILHNMMVLERRGGFFGRQRIEEAATVFGGSAAAALGVAGFAPQPKERVAASAVITEAPPPCISYLEARLTCGEVTDREGHLALREDFVAHIHSDRGALLQPFI